jgi:hypothetical protein
VRAVARDGGGGIALRDSHFPSVAAWALAWIALAPLIVVARTRGARAAALCGALCPGRERRATVHWLPHTIAVYYQQPIALGLALFAA